DNLFECAGWKVMGATHLRLQLRDPRDGTLHDAVMFNAYHGQPPPPRLRGLRADHQRLAGARDATPAAAPHRASLKSFPLAHISRGLAQTGAHAIQGERT